MRAESIKPKKAYWLKTAEGMFHADRVNKVHPNGTIDVEGLAGATKDFSSTAVLAAFEKEVTQEQLRVMKRLIGTDLHTPEGVFKVYDIYLMRKDNQEVLVFTYHNAVGNLQGPFLVSEITTGKKPTFRM